MSDFKINDLINNRQKTFTLNIDKQEYELVVLSFIGNGDIYFYTIFKPIDYDHIIYTSDVTKSWKTAKLICGGIFDDICNKYNLDKNSYPDIMAFTS